MPALGQIDIADNPERMASAIVRAGSATGAFELRGVNDIFRQAQHMMATVNGFFDLDEEIKKWARSPQNFRNRGWNSYADDNGTPNFERFSVAEYDNEDDAAVKGVAPPYRKLYSYVNVWPDGPLRSVVEQFRRAAAMLCQQLFSVAGDRLGIDAGNLAVRGAPHTNLSLTRYYPRPSAATDRRSEDPSYVDHRDVSFLTLLTEAGESGCLQVQDLDTGEWIETKFQGACVVVIFGTLAERLSGGVLRACRHRVLSPQNDTRTSCAVFYSAGLENTIRPADGAPYTFPDSPDVQTVGDVFVDFAGRSLP